MAKIKHCATYFVSHLNNCFVLFVCWNRILEEGCGFFNIKEDMQHIILQIFVSDREV